MELNHHSDETPTRAPEVDPSAERPREARTFSSLTEAREAVEALLESLDPRSASPGS